LGCYGVREFIHSSSPLDLLAEEPLIREYALILINEGELKWVDEFFFQFYLGESGKAHA